MKKSTWLAGPYIIWMILFTVVPILIVAFFAFTTEGDDGSLQFTLQNFARSFDPVFLNSLLKSLWIALLTTIACLLLGYPLAMCLVRQSQKVRSLMVVLFMVPMWMNFLIRTYAWMAIFRGGDAGLLNSFLMSLGFEPVQFLYNDSAIILAMIYNYLPFMILPIYNALEKIQKNTIEAAQDLGANSFKVFTTISLPLTVPGIISGITMVFMPAVTTFAIPKLVGGTDLMIGDMIEKQFLTNSDKNFGSALSIIMMILVLASMLILNHFDKDNEAGGGGII